MLYKLYVLYGGEYTKSHKQCSLIRSSAKSSQASRKGVPPESKHRLFCFNHDARCAEKLLHREHPATICWHLAWQCSVIEYRDI
jgi:hypothetical protein